MVVVLVGLQVLSQVVAACGQQRKLNLRRTGVTLMDGGEWDAGLFLDGRLLADGSDTSLYNICLRRSKGQSRFPDAGHTPKAGPR